MTRLTNGQTDINGRKKDGKRRGRRDSGIENISFSRHNVASSLMVVVAVVAVALALWNLW